MNLPTSHFFKSLWIIVVAGPREEGKCNVQTSDAAAIRCGLTESDATLHYFECAQGHRHTRRWMLTPSKRFRTLHDYIFVTCARNNGSGGHECQIKIVFPGTFLSSRCTGGAASGSIEFRQLCFRIFAIELIRAKRGIL